MAERTKRKGSFVKQAAILATAGILVRFLGFVYRVPLTNMIGDQGNGIYSAGYYIYTFLLILSSAGLPAAISKMVSERIAVKQFRNAHRVFQGALIISGSLGLVFAILMGVFAQQIANWGNVPESYYCILTLSPTIFIVSVMSAFRGYFQGMNTMVPTAISQIVEQVFNAFFSVYLAYVFLSFGVSAGEKNIPMGAAGGTAGTGIGALAGLLVVIFSYFLIRPTIVHKVRKCHQPFEEGRRDTAKQLLKTAWPIIAGTAVFSITNLIDMNMVTRILENTGFSHLKAVDLYGQLSGKYVTLTTLPVSISTALATAALPSIAASAKLNDYKQVRRKTNLTFRISMIISVPAAVGIGVLGGPIIRMLFPSASDGGALLTVGAVSILFLALCQTATGILQGIGHIKVPVVGAILGAITKVILNYVLIGIPELNVLGAVLSTTACYLVAAVFDVVMLSRLTKTKFDMMGTLFKPMVGATAMGVAALAVYHVIHMIYPSNTVATLLSILFAMAIYGMVMLLIGGITEEDLNSLPMGTKIVGILRRFRMI
ncbi:putative polysaccharide biosynthesis protein [Anaerotignum sp. MB30-C6]|uniref:putative polysaccharide biosynthesis protein n=1 Tax=Anaerotignum sp. MB30-C6 TaxID=3070814 RepID=UPI0027DC7E7E|nr:polysaccharide biosynthesis protein [Anaerotignum sp. MB30-C6]WMI79834.1 polysaccharide biosynthesis protein [Anaerotignum sp. MB30-C6]